MSIFLATAELSSAAPYSQSRAVQTEQGTNEDHEVYRDRTWREHCHAYAAGENAGRLYIPGMQFKKALEDAAKYLNMKTKGSATYTKHFRAGITPMTDIVLNETLDTVRSERLFLPSNGIPGAGSRVWKRYPLIPEWKGSIQFMILDELITEKVFATHLKQAGVFIGIGRFRPHKAGFYGRFKVENLTWAPYDIE